MFGYIIANQKKFKPEEVNRYRSYYCGLCHTLKEHYGRTGQITLNFDMTFVYILLSSLYEAPDQLESYRCIVHPLKKHDTLTNSIVDYIADMNILLSYFDLKDDWEDERKLLQGIEANFLQKQYKQIAERFPRQSQVIEEYVVKLRAHETDYLLQNSDSTSSKKNSSAFNSELDFAAGLTGTMMSEILLYKIDEWEAYLRPLGFYLGKFIYLMDAYEDIEKDIKKKQYNPWMESFHHEDFQRFSESVLTSTMAECAKAFELLPILQDVEILRNILYSGVWTRYELVKQKRKGKGGE